jgi:hypothetical protein
MKTLLVISALALFAPFASALTITETQVESYYAQTNRTTAKIIDRFYYTPFDASLGTLQSVEFRMSFTAFVQYGEINPGPNSGLYDRVISVSTVLGYQNPVYSENYPILSTPTGTNRLDPIFLVPRIFQHAKHFHR